MHTHSQPCPSYQRHRPEETPTYQIIRDHLSAFIAQREAEGRPLPRYVLDEFDAYLRCGILSHGFIRLQCTGCKEEKIVAFSCKKRGFCPSCCGKRMVEAAAHLVDNVLPMAPYRQFVISFLIPLRYWLQTNRKLLSRVQGIAIGELHQHYKDKAFGSNDPAPGTISFNQRWGSALNLNPHMHVLALDGVYARHEGVPHFYNSDPISDGEVDALIEGIARKVIDHLKKKGYLDQDGTQVLNPQLDPLFGDNEAIREATVSSIAGKIAFGPNAGKYVTRIGSGFGYEEEIPLAKGRRCYAVHGFSLHANTSTNTYQRDRLEKLIQYMARGPLSNDRLEIRDDGNVLLRLKSSWADGTTHLLFTPSEFIEKLAALIPPPRSHLVRWAGVFAPNSPYRQEITLCPEIRKGFQFKPQNGERMELKNSSWARMLARVFKIDVTICEHCGAEMKSLGAILDPFSVARYLRHVGLEQRPKARAPPRSEQSYLHFDQNDYA